MTFSLTLIKFEAGDIAVLYCTVLCKEGIVVVFRVLLQRDSLQEVGITHIVCVRHPGDTFIRANFPDLFRYWPFT